MQLRLSYIYFCFAQQPWLSIMIASPLSEAQAPLISFSHIPYTGFTRSDLPIHALAKPPSVMTESFASVLFPMKRMRSGGAAPSFRRVVEPPQVASSILAFRANADAKASELRSAAIARSFSSTLSIQKGQRFSVNVKTKFVQLEQIELPDLSHKFPLLAQLSEELSQLDPETNVPSIWPWQQQPGLIFSAAFNARPASSLPPSHLDRLINDAIDAASHDGSRGRQTTGVRAWFAFHRDLGLSPHRPIDPLSPLQDKLNEEQRAMRFVIALVTDRGILPRSAAVYFSQVQGWHAKTHGVKLCGGLKLERLPAMLKGLRRTHGDPPRRVRRGFSPQALRTAMDLLLDPRDPAHANIRAALSTALQGLLRNSEFAVDEGKLWDAAKHINRADLIELTAERLVLMIHQCKNSRQLSGKTSPLVIGAGGKFVDAVAEVHNMLKVDPVPDHLKAFTPMFRDPASNQPLRSNQIMQITRDLLRAIGENPLQFGTHSFRIGGATALFASGADETVIRTMGRWSSDIHRLYVRACFERCVEWTRMAGSVSVHDLAHDFDEVDDY